MRRIKYILCLAIICLSFAACRDVNIANENLNTSAGVQKNTHEEYDKAGKVDVTVDDKAGDENTDRNAEDNVSLQKYNDLKDECESLKQELEALKQQNKTLTEQVEATLKEIEDLKDSLPNAVSNSDDAIVDSGDKKALNTETSEYIANKTIYNCQIMKIDGTWKSITNMQWNKETDTAADGKKYSNAFLLCFDDSQQKEVSHYVVDFLLDNEYSKFSFSRGMLTNNTKSTTYSAVLRIYGYSETPTSQDETPLFQSDTITGGMLPFDGEEFDVSDVKLLRFELINENGGLGYYSGLYGRNILGIILTDAILYK